MAMLVCKDCGVKGKANGVESRPYGKDADIPLCMDCRDARCDARWAKDKARAKCCKCGSPDVVSVLGPPESNCWYCQPCAKRSSDAAWALREKMLAEGGLDLSPTAY